MVAAIEVAVVTAVMAAEVAEEEDVLVEVAVITSAVALVFIDDVSSILTPSLFCVKAVDVGKPGRGFIRARERCKGETKKYELKA